MTHPDLSNKSQSDSATPTEGKLDYKKGGGAMARSPKVIHVPRVRAELYQNKKLIATGQAELTDRDIWFFPEPAKQLTSRLTGAVELKQEGSDKLIALEHPRVCFALGSDLSWSFVRFVS